MRIKQVMFGLISIALAVVLAVVVLRFVFPLPDISDREPQNAIAADPATQLGRLLQAGEAAHPARQAFCRLPMAKTRWRAGWP